MVEVEIAPDPLLGVASPEGQMHEVGQRGVERGKPGPQAVIPLPLQKRLGFIEVEVALPPGLGRYKVSALQIAAEPGVAEPTGPKGLVVERLAK